MNMVSASRFRLADFLGNTAQWELRASADLLPHYAVLPKKNPVLRRDFLYLTIIFLWQVATLPALSMAE